MAIILPGPGIADIRGSIGGVTFARNAGGAYARNRTKPVNPRSEDQRARRAATSQLTTYWSDGLTEEQRQGWRDYASGTTWTNRLGQVITINGTAAFVRTNTIRLILGLAVQEDAPGQPGTAATVTAEVAANDTTQKISISKPSAPWDDTDDNDYVLFFQAQPSNAGNPKARTGWKFLTYVVGGATPPTFPKAVDSLYVLTAGMNQAVDVLHLDTLGRLSSRTTSPCVVATPTP
jgi:hypothetical protein